MFIIWSAVSLIIGKFYNICERGLLECLWYIIFSFRSRIPFSHSQSYQKSYKCFWKTSLPHRTSVFRNRYKCLKLLSYLQGFSSASFYFGHEVTVWKVSKYGGFSGLYFPYLDWMRKFTEWISVFSLNTERYGPEKTLYLDTFHAVDCLKQALTSLHIPWEIWQIMLFFLFLPWCL